MRIIHCTRKLFKELDVSLVEPDKIPLPTEGLGNWYVTEFPFVLRLHGISINEYL
jgi:hypothetical protein